MNELLVQMETFPGIFIASTNLMSRLDTASLRRFEFKIKFDYMKPAQSWALFNQILSEQGYTAETSIELFKIALSKIDTLTPGDFATVLRQSLSLGREITPKILLDELKKEVAAKPNYTHAIGFM